MASTLIIGLGQAGRQAAALLMRSPSSQSISQEYLIALADLADAQTQQRAFNDSLASDARALAVATEPGRVQAFPLDPSVSGQGQGRHWFLGRALARRFFANMREEARDLVKRASDGHRTYTIAAGGGGTGSGAAPIFVDHLKQAAIEAGRDDALTLAATILPIEREWGRLEDVNAAALLSELLDADGVLVADNAHVRDALNDDDRAFDFLGATRDPELVVSRALMSTIGMIESFAREGIAGWGNAELARFLQPGRRAALIAPAYSEVAAEALTRVNLAGWILVNATATSLVRNRAETAKRVLAIVQFPRGTVPNETPEEIASFLRQRIFQKATEVEVRFLTREAPGDRIRIVTLLAEPVIPRVFYLYKALEEASENPELATEVRRALMPLTGRGSGHEADDALDAHRDARERLRRLVKDAWGSTVA